MIIRHVKRDADKNTYWYHNTTSSKMMNMRSFYYVTSWLPDIEHNIVSIEELIKNYDKDFTYREFFTELLMLVTEYQQAVKDGWMSASVFDLKIKTFNHHLNKHKITIILDL